MNVPLLTLFRIGLVSMMMILTGDKFYGLLTLLYFIMTDILEILDKTNKNGK